MNGREEANILSTRWRESDGCECHTTDKRLEINMKVGELGYCSYNGDR